MAAEIELKVRVTAEEFLALEQVAEAELRTRSNLARHAIREYLRQRVTLISPEIRAALGTGWDQ